MTLYVAGYSAYVRRGVNPHPAIDHSHGKSRELARMLVYIVTEEEVQLEALGLLPRLGKTTSRKALCDSNIGDLIVPIGFGVHYTM